ncbi:MAG: hypothetical protein ABSB13_08015 [Candidatus Binatus sp.]|jgi:uncharacterized membrane protein YdcZ (DUF606 family)|uniref:hypothetical protein n=1 Tax=Candidatus Binatus sp. TaxID=2811406 RepID=UPI003D120005
MDPEAAAVVNPHLLAREELLWCGRPRDTSALRWRAGAIILVAIAALVMRSIPLGPGLAERADTNSILLAVLVGVLIAEAIVFHSYLSNTFYGVTNQRVIIVSGFREQQVTAAFLDKLNTPMLTLRRMGNTLELRGALPEFTRRAMYRPFWNPSVLTPPGQPECYRLVGLENAGEVYRIILDAVDKI